MPFVPIFSKCVAKKESQFYRSYIGIRLSLSHQIAHFAARSEQSNDLALLDWNWDNAAVVEQNLRNVSFPDFNFCDPGTM